MERGSINYTLLIGTLSILGVMVFSPHLVYAQEDTSRPVILPDSPFYGIKLAIENLQEAFTFQDERKAELILKHSEERDREAEVLESQGKMIPIERLKEIQGQKLRQAEVIIQRLERAQNIIDQTQQNADERRELAQATNEQERISIQMQQRARELAEGRVLIEPKLGMGLIEPNTIRVSDVPIVVVPVTDIEDDDDQRTILTKLRQRLENSFSTSEVTEIRARFAELRGETDPERQVILADRLDDQVNNPIISITCFGFVDTLLLARADDPVQNLQEQCPILRPFNTEMVRDVINGGN
ncbi:MAG: DUF5667 domain-containing protein [Patescibacteria group bacterium]|nr:DUF5667 domain-containing protein [Patescibacteria group bacterium]